MLRLLIPTGSGYTWVEHTPPAPFPDEFLWADMVVNVVLLIATWAAGTSDAAGTIDSMSANGFTRARRGP